MQIVEVRELVEEIAPRFRFDDPAPAVAHKPAAAPALFAKLSQDDLLSTGVPEDWIADVLKATEDQFFDLAPHLPAEAAEALLQYATVGLLPKPEPAEAEDPYSHPDALRRFRTVDNLDELRQALDAPWEKWAVFLHPSQRQIVERDFHRPGARRRIGGNRQDRRGAAPRCAARAKRPERARAAHDLFRAPGEGARPQGAVS